MTKGPVEVAPNVFRITVGQGAFLGVYAPNVYLVVGDDGAAFIDTAYGEDEEVEAQLECWRSCDKPPVSGIVLTHRHPDHIGGALRLRGATGGAVVATAVEREPIERALGGAKLTRAVEDGEALVLGGATLEFVHTPGHTRGSLCVYHRELGIL